MIIRCDNCSVSLQVDESKIPSSTFTVRCPRCQNLVRADTSKNGSATVEQLKSTSAAPAVQEGSQEFAEKQSEAQINSALRALLSALQTGGPALEEPESEIHPRRVLLCLGKEKDAVSKVLAGAGFKVYVASTPAQANERLRDGKTEVLLFSSDFAEEYGGAAIIQQKVNAMFSSERRRLYLVSIEDGGQTLNAHEAFLRNINLIVSSGDVDQLPMILDKALSDFNDLYTYYNRATGVAEI
ncbi:MAG TPA: zinc-ribbon domain-containing protein [Aridibacter sp.]|nr:zinc-ribbon domain-containing protein [Aridibacter sp.]